MKYLFFLSFVMFCFSCSKSVEERCFVQENEKYFNAYEEPEIFSVKEILKHQPEYLQIINLKKYRSFKIDSLESRNIRNTVEADEKYLKDQKILFADFEEKFFGQFLYSNKQIQGSTKYALGRNGLGYWLLEIKNNIPSAYFLGLSFSHYHINEMQENTIVKDGFLQLEGSFVKIVSDFVLRGKEFGMLEEGKLFKIKLEDLKKDSDHDGYSDIFENSFGLDPDNEDTDSDGINDFEDRNPFFRSEKNKFTSLYETLINQHLNGIKQDLYKMSYFMLPFENDCDYFQRIKIDTKVLIYPEDKEKQPYYVRITDIFNGGYSKITINKNNPNIFHVTDWGGSSSIIYKAEYKNGKWIFKNVGGINI